VDNEGHALTYDGSAWSGAVGVDGSTALESVSCPTTFCVAVDASGRYLLELAGRPWPSLLP
jgi:hypothetical protein